MRKAIVHLKRADPVLGRLIQQVGPYRIEYAPADFATLARSIIYQQLSGKVALVMYNRLEAAASNLDGGRLTPNGLLALTPKKMRAAGLSRQKIAYLRDLAQRTLSGEVDFAAFEQLPDDEVTRLLTAVKGIGPWTVQMFLIFALRRADVLPSADLGIRVAVKRAYELAELPTPAEVNRVAVPWRPYATVASWYLWRSLEDKAGL